MAISGAGIVAPQPNLTNLTKWLKLVNPVARPVALGDRSSDRVNDRLETVGGTTYCHCQPSSRRSDQALGRQPPRPDNQVKAHFDAIRTERDQLELDISEAAFIWRELNSQLLGPREMQELHVAIERGRVLCRSALDELGEMIKSTDAKLRDLKTNDQVKKALVDLKDLRLDHSSRYQNILKQIKQWEAFVKATAESVQPRTEPVSKKKPGLRKR